ncbi:MAG TPA: aminotransferase class V-fold PLP-dependent enzyme [Bryobacteraceae bacterium]|nr:aminotransferase class V-fold PLP-dependent enzyme [Bryobacteraceae bacterium]
MASPSSIDWRAVRNEFPALENWTYLNTATFGQLPRRATQGVCAHFQHRDELACWDFLSWYGDADRLRGKIARLIHCNADDVAFIPNATAALGVLSAGIGWRRGDQVLTLKHEFPNNLYAPAMLGRFGVEMIECPWERLYESVSERTRLVLISSVNYMTGFAPPLEELSAFLRARGVLLYVDGTQSVGALQFDAARIQPAMLAVHGYKWMLAPTGAGFMYVHPDVREWLPPNAFGWRSHRGWSNVDNLHHGTPELTGAAEKYEGGNLASALLYALEASVDLMLEIGPERIEERVLCLSQKTRALLRDLGAIVQDDRSPIVAARFEARDVSALARSLKEERVLVAARRGNLRVSTHLYNDEQDLETLSTALRRLR